MLKPVSEDVPEEALTWSMPVDGKRALYGPRPASRWSPKETQMYLVTGGPTAMDYLAERFAGKQAPNDC
ncbi:MAG: hypothetical protein GEV00_21215 [Actinophytocola sp.]|nr:hypothetical protein [Actinophytocola sp.]